MSRIALLAMIALLLLTTACTGGPTQQTAPTAVPSAAPPDEEVVNPLTGLLVPAAVLAQPPLIIKVSNAPDEVRPQSGLAQADHVYEHYVEAGLTRFSAVYLTNRPERVGSVRSARLIDLELVPLYNALFAYSGASDGVLARLQGSAAYPRMFSEAGGVGFTRDDAIAAPNNLFVLPEALWQAAAAAGFTGAARSGLAFDADVPARPFPGRFASLRYRTLRIEWVYDGDLNRYRRLIDGEPHIDALTDETITAANVVILYARHRETDIVESVGADGTNFYSLAIQLVGTGDAVVLRGGNAFSVTWSRMSEAEPLRFLDQDGFDLNFLPGNVWFQVFPPTADWLPGVELARYA